jgi:hypothetical protein
MPNQTYLACIERRFAFCAQIFARLAKTSERVTIWCTAKPAPKQAMRVPRPAATWHELNKTARSNQNFNLNESEP